jgi:hypothetical protein
MAPPCIASMTKAGNDGCPDAKRPSEAGNQEDRYEKGRASSHQQAHSVQAATVAAVMTTVGVVFCRLACFIHHGAPDLRPRVDNPALLKSSP